MRAKNSLTHTSSRLGPPSRGMSFWDTWDRSCQNTGCRPNPDHGLCLDDSKNGFCVIQRIRVIAACTERHATMVVCSLLPVAVFMAGFKVGWYESKWSLFIAINIPINYCAVPPAHYFGVLHKIPLINLWQLQSVQQPALTSYMPNSVNRRKEKRRGQGGGNEGKRGRRK